MTVTDPRTPVIVGVSQHTYAKGQQPGPEPLAAWESVCRRAADDAAVSHTVLASLDMLSVADCLCWNYDDAAGRLAERLGATPKLCHTEMPSGTTAHYALARATKAIKAGEIDLAVIVGGEMFATLKAYAKAGETPPWSFINPKPPVFDINNYQHPGEIGIGLTQGGGAVNSFAMRDIARRAHLGISPQAYREQLGGLLAGMTKVAAGNPDAWFPEARSAEFLITPRVDNRMIAYPYTKHMVSIMEVDIAAALIVTSEEKANRLGIAREKRVYPWAGCYTKDPYYMAVQENLWKSNAMQAAAKATLDAAGVTMNDVSYIDLYSCFTSAVNISKDALGISDLPGERITVTGGLPYAGGPGSSYVHTSMTKLTELLRKTPGSIGLAGGVGMWLSNHSYGIYSTRPPRSNVREVDERAVQAQVDLIPQRAIDDRYEGSAAVVTYTIMYDRAGDASHGAAICDLPNGARAYARILDKDLLREAEEVELAGARLKISRKNDVGELRD